MKLFKHISCKNNGQKGKPEIPTSIAGGPMVLRVAQPPEVRTQEYKALQQDQIKS